MERIGRYSFDEYLDLVKSFHGYAAPGLIMGGFMVDLALGRLPEGTLFDAVSETTQCLPDAIQILTPCTVGNGWLKVFNLGRFALTLHEKYEGEGVRVYLDPGQLDAWSEIKTWLFKLKPKREQDSELLRSQLREAGRSLYSVHSVRIQPHLLRKRSKGQITQCVLCGEAYPRRDGPVCRGCRGEAPYVIQPAGEVSGQPSPGMKAVAAEDAVGHTVLHDMTIIEPGVAKGPAFKRGQRITPGDVCRLQQMGRQTVYVQEMNEISPDWVHEDVAAVAFAKAMAGEGITFEEPPREGRINLKADRDGLLVVDVERLETFNMVPGVMCASRKTCTLATRGRHVAATRAIPLLLPRGDFERAMTILREAPLFRVLPMRRARVGILVTGSEVFHGLVEDRFIPIISAKVERYGCEVVKSLIAPDDREAIRRGVQELLDAGADLVVTTAGLSVDPDDLTRQGLVDAGATEVLYGTPIVPGAMILLARIGSARVMGVPACALYFKTTGFDLLLPRVLAGTRISRRDLARMGHGSFCLGCKTCTFPKCPFGG
ncbi:MAG: FmdE family protein [Syntrophobacteraceae bacterium]|jgi:formylmethanofuran dehydrogenase subunit E|nr:FmdE family protein [Syntrophobacteraceae bacterium]